MATLHGRFAALRSLRDRSTQGLKLDTLSMGMSHDMESPLPKGRRWCASARQSSENRA
jgi:uncharacterized pyridoxal phosphate-containing UPF0001 family protein